MAFTGLFTYETEAQEAARLAESPVGSINHALSSAPVRIQHIRRAQLIELPREATRPGSGLRTIVLTNELRPSHHTYGPGELNRRDHTWACIVVASNDDRYPVGGYDLAIGEAELRRGRLITAQQLLSIEEN